MRSVCLSVVVCMCLPLIGCANKNRDLVATHQVSIETDPGNHAVLTGPDVIAKVTNDIGYANANEKATPLVNPELSGNPAMYPPESGMGNIYTIGVRTGEGTRVLTREFTRAKTGQ